MATCTVTSFTPGQGPSDFMASAVETNINEDFPAWNLTHNTNENETVFTSLTAGVTGTMLNQQIAPHFHGFLVTHS